MEQIAYVCRHVFENSRPILFVSRGGGDWQCLCGEEHAADEIPHVVGLNHLLERDAALTELQDLPEEWEAERVSVQDDWVRTQIESDA